MHLPATLTIPHWRAIFRHALPNVIEGKLVPTVTFLALLHWLGATVALGGALAWSLGAVARRCLRRERVSGILVLTTLALIAKTVAAIATGSLFIYFLQPTVATCLFGLSFFLSVMLGKPLVERLAMDVVPFEEPARSHPALRRFFRHVTLWWGFTSMINFTITLWLLLSHSPTTFVLVKSFLGPATTALTMTVAFFWFRSQMARHGTRVVFAPAHRGLQMATV